MRVSHSSHATYQRWQDLKASGAIGDLAGFDVGRQVNWFRGDAAVSITPMLVTANYFDVLGVPMSRGRGFTADEARMERDPRLAVVSHSFWQHELAADSAVIGRSLTINGASYTVIGVLAPKLRSPVIALAPPVYLPLNASLVPDVRTPDARVVQLIGRLEAGQAPSEARSALDAVDRRLARAGGDTLYGGVQEFGRVGTMGDKKLRTVGAFFVILSVVSLLVLLIACGNVAGLLMARATARRPEIAIRLAIGGTRSRLVQQLMVEAFWLALFGTLAGLGLAAVALRVFNGISLPASLPLELHLALDPAVLLCALALLFITMVASALLPTLGASRMSLMPALKRDDTLRVGGGRRLTTRGLMLAGQVTISTVLLVTAFLFLRNLQLSHLANPGFDVDRVIVAQVGFNQGRGGEAQDALLRRQAERVRALPGVTSTAFGAVVPLSMHAGSSNGRSARFDERPERHIEYAQAAVGAGYFATLGIRLLSGRDFGPADRVGAPNVVIVNQEFARRYLDGNAVGHSFRFTDENPRIEREIVGVVANSKYHTIGEDLRPAMYLPMPQRPENRDIAFVYARVEGDPAQLVAALRSAIGEVDPAVSVAVQPMRSALAFALLPSRVGAAVLGGLGLLGLILAAFGLFAIVSYNVSRRVSEIAIRSALGATRRAIVGLVIRDASVLVGAGVVAGLGIAALATRALSAFLVTGLSATDPLSFIGTAAVFLVVTIVASWSPVRFATRVSPVIAMRLD